MSKSKTYEQRVQNQFGSFCVNVLKNASRNIDRDENRHYDREKSIYDLTGSEITRLAVYDDYFADERTFHLDGHSIVLKDEMLAEALKQLPENKRNIIIRSYFMGMTDEEIAAEFNVVRQTISKKRAKILAELKKHLSEEATNG